MDQGVTGKIIEKSNLDVIMDNVIVIYVLKIIGAILVILILLMIGKFIATFVSKRVVANSTEGNKHIDKIGRLIHDIIFYILIIFSFFIGFEIVGFNVGLILGGISFGVGLAFKEILGNMIAGTMVLYTKEFKLGDIIEVFADQTYFGRIEEITIRYTVIRTLDLRQVVLPNMTLITVPIKTFSAEDIVKLSATFEVHYDSDIPKVLEVVTKAINGFTFTKEKENTKVFVSNFGDSNIEIKAFFYFDPKCGIIPDIALGEINEKINQEFEKNNIEISYDTVTLTFEDTMAKQAFIKNIENTTPSI